MASIQPHRMSIRGRAAPGKGRCDGRLEPSTTSRSPYPASGLPPAVVCVAKPGQHADFELIDLPVTHGKEIEYQDEAGEVQKTLISKKFFGNDILVQRCIEIKVF